MRLRVLQTNSNNFTATNMNLEMCVGMCAGIVKAPKLHIKNAAETKTELLSAFYKSSHWLTQVYRLHPCRWGCR